MFLNQSNCTKLKSLKTRFTTLHLNTLYFAVLEVSKRENESEYVRIAEGSIPKMGLFQFCPKATN